MSNNQSLPYSLVGGETLDGIFLPLSRWYHKNARPLPWREDKDPYHVWLSEVMLQQTRIEAVRPYYARFLAAAPNISALAELPDDRLMKLWEGLGYYSRARNLKKAARQMAELHGGEMPKTYEEIRALPGVGDYTAGAIASIVYGLPCPAVDGNVLRVLARLTADPSDVMLPETKKRMTEALRQVYQNAAKTDFATHGCPEICEKPAAVLTQALMELGQTHCLPNTSPRCEQCPLSSLCCAHGEGSTARIPYRGKKKPRRTEQLLVFLLRDPDGNWGICRRPEGGLLGGLWELPNCQISDTSPDTLDAAAERFCKENCLLPAESAAVPSATHLFTHIEWRMEGRYINVVPQVGCNLLFVSSEELSARYAVPSAFSRFLTYIRGEK